MTNLNELSTGSGVHGTVLPNDVICAGERISGGTGRFLLLVPCQRAFDLPLCAAGIHPDATAEQLDLTTDWHEHATAGHGIANHRSDVPRWAVNGVFLPTLV
jgi:hypothetical protein